MLLEQKERIIKIVEAIDGLPNSTRIKGLQYPPDNMDNVDLPALLLGTGAIRPEELDIRNHKISIIWNWTLFIRRHVTGATIQGDYEPTAFSDILLDEFLSRPHLDFGDTGLDNISKPIVIAFNGDTSRPISYPLGTNSVTKYWGITGTLSITAIRQIELAT